MSKEKNAVDAAKNTADAAAAASAAAMRETREAAINDMAANLVNSAAMLVERGVKHSLKAQMGLAYYGVGFEGDKLSAQGREKLLRPNHPGWRIVAAAAWDPKALRLEIVRTARRSGLYAEDAVFDDIAKDLAQVVDETAKPDNPLIKLPWIGTVKAVAGFLLK